MDKNFTDQELVKRAQQGDGRAFDLLTIKYRQRIVSLICNFVHNISDAQDIAQEAFIKAYRALPNFRCESSFYTWIYRIAVNTAKNYLTVKSRRPLHSLQDSDNMEQIESRNALSDNQTPERLLLRDEIQQAIINSVESLPEDLKTAITLREIDGLSYADIANVMDCPIGTVRSRIFRAREAIDKELELLIEDI